MPSEIRGSSNFDSDSAGKVIQVVGFNSQAEVDWSDGSTQTVFSHSITTSGDSKVKVDFVVPTYCNSTTGAWPNMAWLSLKQGSITKLDMEHDGVNSEIGSVSRNIAGTYLSATLSAGTHTFSFDVNPYQAVRWRAFRDSYTGQVVLTEISND